MTADHGNNKSEVLVILMPWEAPEWFLKEAAKTSPGISVVAKHTGYDATSLDQVDIDEATWKKVTVLFTWRAFPLPKQVPNLRYVQLTSAGANHLVGKPLYDDTDIAFCTANGVHPPQIAEWVFATYLGFQHHISRHLENQKIGKWVDTDSDESTEDSYGLTMGILGYGSIGRQCARIAQALGMKTHAFTLHERKTQEAKRDESFMEPGLGDPEGDIPEKWFFGNDQLNTFLSGLDLLVILLPLTNPTRGMIGAEQFKAMSKKKTFVSNAGRGAVIHTESLMAALNEGLIKGAALDVTDPEPLPEGHPLWKCPNVTITPHDSGTSNSYNTRVLRILLKNLDRLGEGKDLLNQVDRRLGY